MDRYANLRYERFFARSRRVIFHIDLDSFYVSCERIIRPWLRGRPVVISHDRNSAVITSSSYEVRKMYTHSAGIPLGELRAHVNNLYVVEPNRDLYEAKSQEFFQYLKRNYSPFIERVSIDEVFMDVTNFWQPYGSPRRMALSIQDALTKNLQLPCTIGISYTKFGAKMANKLAKPMGIRMVSVHDWHTSFYHLPLIDYYGIGPKSVERLKSIGINTIGDLAHCSYENLALRQILGRRMLPILENAKGIGDDYVVSYVEANKEISKSHTFIEGPTTSRNQITHCLKLLINAAVARATEEQLVGETIVVMIRLPDKEGWISKQRRLKNLTSDTTTLLRYATILLDSLLDQNIVYGVGFKLKDLVPRSQNVLQHTLFD